MVYVEKIERNGKTYYYITKNFRISGTQWKKIRKYVGSKPPSKNQITQTITTIETEAVNKGIGKLTSRYKYLTNPEGEKLQDLKEVYHKWYGKLHAAEIKKYDEDFIVRFTYNTNAIEGNRLSLRETSMILTEHIIPAGATPNDYNETINSHECYEFIKRYTGEFNQKFFLTIHGILTKNTQCKLVGHYRDHDVRISGSEWIPPSYTKVREEMRKVFQWYYAERKKLHPVELGAVLHNKLVRLHPFSDGNGRTSRVIMNWILMKNKFPMVYVELKDKIHYYEAIEEGDKGNETKIVQYIASLLMQQFTFKSPI